MSIPALFAVVQHVRSEAGKDGHGNPIWSWTDASRAVYGWHDPSSTEPVASGVTAVLVDRQMLAPTFPVSPGDEFTFPDGRFRVEGHARDYDHGPFAYEPGMVVDLMRGE